MKLLVRARRLLAALVLVGPLALPRLAWADEPVPPAFRLGDDAAPLAYDVHLAVDPDATRRSRA